MSDLLDRLKDWHDDWPAQEICKKAADEIERLRAALRIARQWMPIHPINWEARRECVIVDAALEPTPGRKTR